jgi:tetratricopeptide (TPR) repeat protein
MYFAYTIMGLLLVYAVLAMLTYARFHWGKPPRLSAFLSAAHSADEIELIRADALFQQGRFLHEKGFFTAAAAVYEQCFSLETLRPLARQHHKFAQLRQAPPSLVADLTNDPSAPASKEFSPLDSILQGASPARSAVQTSEGAPSPSKEAFGPNQCTLESLPEPFVEAAQVPPDDYFQKGIIHLEHKRPAAAIADFTKAIECAPDFAEAYDKRGQAYILSNLYLDAINDFDKAVACLPEYLDSYLNRGQANSQRGLHDAAIADFSRAIEINPQSDAAFYHRGLEWQNKGDYLKARQDLNQACKLGNNAACLAFLRLQELG